MAAPPIRCPSSPPASMRPTQLEQPPIVRDESSRVFLGGALQQSPPLRRPSSMVGQFSLEVNRKDEPAVCRRPLLPSSKPAEMRAFECTGFCREAFLNTVWTLLCWFLSATRPGFVAYEPVRLFKRGGRCLAPAAGRFVLEHLPGLLSREPPVDLGPFLIGLPVPSPGFPLQRCQIRNPSRA